MDARRNHRKHFRPRPMGRTGSQEPTCVWHPARAKRFEIMQTVHAKRSRAKHPWPARPAIEERETCIRLERSASKVCKGEAPEKMAPLSSETQAASEANECRVKSSAPFSGDTLRTFASSLCETLENSGTLSGKTPAASEASAKTTATFSSDTLRQFANRPGNRSKKVARPSLPKRQRPAMPASARRKTAPLSSNTLRKFPNSPSEPPEKSGTPLKRNASGQRGQRGQI